jgi:hypothetical protein
VGNRFCIFITFLCNIGLENFEFSEEASSGHPQHAAPNTSNDQNVARDELVNEMEDFEIFMKGEG